MDPLRSLASARIASGGSSQHEGAQVVSSAWSVPPGTTPSPLSLLFRLNMFVCVS